MIPLKTLRLNRGLTQSELAKSLGISPSAVRMYETGQRSPDYNTLKRIAALFNVSTDYLLGYDSSHSSIPELTKDEEKFLSIYRGVPVSSRSSMLSIVKSFADALNVSSARVAVRA